MKKLFIIFFALLISSCSKEGDIINCEKASVLNTVIEMEKNDVLQDIIVILGHKSVVENNSEFSLINKCMMVKTYKENNEIIKALYDSYKGNHYVFTYYFTKQIENCLGEVLSEKLDIKSTLDIYAKADKFMSQYSSTNCENLLDKD